MTLVDEAIGSEDLLQLLEYLDRILEVYGGSRKNERIATVAFSRSLFPLSMVYSASHMKDLREEMLIIRNVDIDRDTYAKIFKGHPLGPAKTELDLFFLNAPTAIGHPSEGKINFYVEIEMGGDVASEEQHLIRLRRYFREKGLEIYPVLVCNQYKDWDDTLKIPILDIADLRRIVEAIEIRSLNDIPGMQYEWAATSLRLLEYIAIKGEVGTTKDLWDSYPDLRQLDFGRFVEKGKISADDFEDFNFSFRNRMNSILGKMNEKGLLNKDDKGKYESSCDGRDILGCYLSMKEEKE
jgi:hypothetical protein